MRKHLLVLGLYTALALLVTWPLALRFGTHVIGDGSDDPALTWNLWWFKHAVLDLHASPLSTDFMFYPIGINLVFYTLTLLNDALSLPLQAVFGLVPAANVLLLSSFVLSGYGAFLLTRYLLREWTLDVGRWTLEVGNWKLENRDWDLGRSRGIWDLNFASAFVAGLVFAFSSNKLLYASLGQFNIASSQWIPFYALYLFKLRDSMADGSRPSVVVRHAVLAALFLLLQAYAEFTFASFLIVFTFFFLLSHLRPFRTFVVLARSLALMGVVFAVGFAPILLPMLDELRAEGDIFVQGSGFAEAFSADALGFFVPSKLNPIVGTMDGWFAFPYINFVFIGWVTLALALLGVWHYRRQWLAKFWSLTTLAFVVISLGPSLRVNGNELIGPLPFTLFQLLPFFNGNRYPSRYSVMITLGVAVLVGFGVRFVLGKLVKIGGNNGNQNAVARRVLISPNLLLFPLISLLLLLEHWSVLPLSDFRVPTFYDAIRNEPGDFTVLELPLDWRNGFRITGTPDKVFMLSQWYQTTHEKRMLSGNTSRNPELKFQYFTEAPVINSLIALETNHEIDAATLAQDKQLAPDVMRFFDVRYIVLRPEAGDRLRPYLETVLPDLQLWREENDVRVYRLPPTPTPNPSPATNSASQGRGVVVDPKSPMARLYFAEGWGELGEQRMWAQRHETRLLLPLPNADSMMTLRLTIPAEGQRVSVFVNEQFVTSIALNEGATDHRVPVAQQYMHEGINAVVLRWEKLFSFSDVQTFLGSRFIISLVAKSAGEEVGDFAHIWHQGIYASKNYRGYNLMTELHGSDATLDWTDAFDTFESTRQADRLAERLKNHVSFPQMDPIIALAVRDEASRRLTPQLIDVLQSIGSQAHIGWRWSHAFIRYQDAQNVIIREDASPIRPAIVSIGERITSPYVAGAVEWIEVRASEGAK